MTPERFNEILDIRLHATRDVLGFKAGEYASTSDRLHNFKAAAAMLRGTPEQALLGMLVKHMVSICDMVLDGQPRAIALWNEKIGDAINYLILLEALVKEGEPAATVTYHSQFVTNAPLLFEKVVGHRDLGRCDFTWAPGNGDYEECILARGHDGPHMGKP